jgi:hypothetical protein
MITNAGRSKPNEKLRRIIVFWTAGVSPAHEKSGSPRGKPRRFGARDPEDLECRFIPEGRARGGWPTHVTQRLPLRHSQVVDSKG